jgi:hypothetical protein
MDKSDRDIGISFTALCISLGWTLWLLTFGTIVVQGQVHRELIDPCLGLHWQRVINPVHPEWPERLIPMGEVLVDPIRSQRVAATGDARVPDARPAFVIHVGEHIAVEQQTAVMYAKLQAVALESGTVGQRLRVRLNVGKDGSMSMNGPVIVVVAAAKGLARW